MNDCSKTGTGSQTVTSRYPSGEGRRECQERGRGLRGTHTNMHKINKLPAHTVQHREHSQYFITTLNRVYSIKALNHYVIHLKLIIANQLTFKKTFFFFKKENEDYFSMAFKINRSNL